MDDTETLQQQLSDLQLAHRDLDDVINHLIETRPFDPVSYTHLTLPTTPYV